MSVVKTKTKTKPNTMIGFGLASDWPSRWREIFKPITERSKAKPISDYFRYSIENRSIREQTLLVATVSKDVDWMWKKNSEYTELPLTMHNFFGS